eukprot:g5988.t1
MHRVSASASRSLPRQDLRRYSYKLSYPADNDGKEVVQAGRCRCPLPERPDEWSDQMWRKYLAAMALLPCKLCKTKPTPADYNSPPAVRSSVPQGGSTTSLTWLLSKGKKHYKDRKKDSKNRGNEEADAQQIAKQQQQQQQQQEEEEEEEEKQHDGKGGAPPAEGLCATPFCATTTPSSVAEATSAAAAVFPRRKKGAVPWEEE